MKYEVLPVKKTAKFDKPPVFLTAVEDTYVINGDEEYGADTLKDKNFCDSDILHFKADAKNGKLYRKVLLKFDISALSGEKLGKVSLRLYGAGAQDPNGTGTAKIYDVCPKSWDEKTVTFNTTPEKGELVTSANLGKGYNYINLTDYINKKLTDGKTVVSLLLDGEDSEPFHVKLASTKAKLGAPQLMGNYTEYGYVTDIAANDEVDRVWAHATEMVKEWCEDWADITARGDAPAEYVNEKPEEYDKIVDVTKKPGTPYIQRPTRTVDSIVGYEPAESGEIKLDEYGGYICDKKFEATGWFHVEEKYGRLWTVTPSGNPFFRRAMVSLSPGSEGRQRTAVIDKCGSLEDWAERETKFLKDDLGFNSLGGWSAIDHLSKVDKPMALSHIVGFVSVYARKHGMNNSTGGSTTFVGGVMPVFDPAFAEFSDERAKEVVTPYADNPYVYGWMSDNELHCEQKLLDAYLMADNSNPWFAYSYATAWTFLCTVTGKQTVDVSDVTDEHRLLFRGMIYNKYLKTVSCAVKKYAPNHMFMGSRFLPGCYRDEYVQRVAGKWCDVISLNYYGAWTPESELMQNIQKWSGTPFIITEWYAKGMDVQKKEPRLTNESGAGFTVRTQKDRGYFYHNYTLKLMECKGCAGFDWFKMWDNDPDNLKADLSNRNSNKGIYDNDYNVYEELADEMRTVNNNCYKLIEFFDSDKTRSN